MSAKYKIDAGALGAELSKAEGKRAKAIRAGILSAARRGADALVRATPRYLGQMANSWKASPTEDGAMTRNDAPHAGIIECGARPHPVSSAGMDALAQWAERQLGVDPKTARGVAFGIAQKLKLQGQKGHWMARDYSKGDGPAHLRQEVERALRGAQ